ncbi:hypothetical protein CPB83DRAFT_863758 [Crepidotus variabilis]|uniref:Uncharacterized protein n=1 Tax=Crepidotus variabilis TaxID=179855 RepID=A0A9P6E5G9_9AGAR|nr:hypothetical protein CPB83DRAFT_863758 [Crepidotus variabilis]
MTYYLTQMLSAALILSILIRLVSSQPNCTSESVLCSPRATCCPSGAFCNFNAAIPVCQYDQSPVRSGWRDSYAYPCENNPYLFSCDQPVNIQGFCCPIGSICLTVNSDPNKVVSCIDALGITTGALPASKAASFSPSLSVAQSTEPALLLSPEKAWNTTEATAGSCGSNTFHSTNVVNATISFNYTGPSILLNAMTSPQGGVFAVFIDGTQIKNSLDTFDAGQVKCIRRQYPPFSAPGPPGFGSRTSHSITIMHYGPSKLAPNGTVSSVVQLDSFVVPQFNRSVSGESRAVSGTYFFVFFAFQVFSMSMLL